MLLLYTHTISSRLQYIVDFISNELFDEAIQITTDKAYFSTSTQPRLNYSAHEFSEEEFFLRNKPLLFETGIRSQTILCFEANFHKAFFEPRAIFHSIYLPHHFTCLAGMKNICSMIKMNTAVMPIPTHSLF